MDSGKQGGPNLTRQLAPLPVTATGGFWAVVGILWFLEGRQLLLPYALAAGLHELAHLTVLRLSGIPVFSLELRVSGAVIRAGLTGTLREIPALLAGPGINLLLGLAFRRLWPMFCLCNLGLAACNLLPLSSLDGGRVCAIALPRLFGRPGQMLCQLLHWAVLTGIVFLGIWGTCVLHLGLLPAAAAAFFLLRLPNVLDKPAADW